MSLGDLADEIQRRVDEGYPDDRCAMCLTRSALLHPVGKAWACSRCHYPAIPRETEQ